MVGLGLFAPLPLAVMIPFMAGQSFAMGEAFGKGFQFGKRKISSMTNEDFNKLTGPQAFAETTADITAMIPTMSNAMEKFHTLQTDIILKMIDYIAKLPSEVLPTLAEAPGLIVPQEWKVNYPEAYDATIKWLKENIPKLIPSLPSASASVPPLDHRPTTTRTGDILDDRLSAETLALANKQAADARARQRTLAEAKLKTEQKLLSTQVVRTGVVTSRRAAGQSQIIQRTQLVNAIAKQARHISAFRKNWSAQALESQMAKMRTFQAQLTILLQRYRF